MSRGGWSTGGLTAGEASGWATSAADTSVSVPPRPAEPGAGTVDLSPRRSTGGEGFRISPGGGDSWRGSEVRVAPMTRGGWSTGGVSEQGGEATAAELPRFSGGAVTGGGGLADRRSGRRRLLAADRTAQRRWLVDGRPHWLGFGRPGRRRSFHQCAAERAFLGRLRRRHQRRRALGAVLRWRRHRIGARLRRRRIARRRNGSAAGHGRRRHPRRRRLQRRRHSQRPAGRWSRRRRPRRQRPLNGSPPASPVSPKPDWGLFRLQHPSLLRVRSKRRHQLWMRGWALIFNESFCCFPPSTVTHRNAA